MDSFIKSIKKKLSAENLVDALKDSKVAEESAVKEEAVRNTLQKIDPNSMLDVDEMHEKLIELSDANKTETSTSQRLIEAAKSGIKSLSKSKEELEKGSTENQYMRALGREENVFKLYDDIP